MNKTIVDLIRDIPKLNLEKAQLSKTKLHAKISITGISAVLSVILCFLSGMTRAFIIFAFNLVIMATQCFYSNRIDSIVETEKIKEKEKNEKSVNDLQNELEYEKTVSFVRDSLTRSLDDVLSNGDFKPFYTKFNDAIKTLFTQINKKSCNELAFHLYSYDKTSNTISRLVVDHFSNQVRPARKKDRIKGEKCIGKFYYDFTIGNTEDENAVLFSNHHEVLSHLKTKDRTKAQHWEQYFAKRIITEKVIYLIEIIGFAENVFPDNNVQTIVDKVTQPVESYLDIIGGLVIKAFLSENANEKGAA